MRCTGLQTIFSIHHCHNTWKNRRKKGLWIWIRSNWSPLLVSGTTSWHPESYFTNFLSVAIRAVVATNFCLSTVTPSRSRLSRQGALDAPLAKKLFSVDTTEMACRQSQNSWLSRHCRDRVSTTALVAITRNMCRLNWWQTSYVYISISIKESYITPVPLIFTT